MKDSRSGARRLLFISWSALENSPYPDVALPCLAEAGWNITVAAPAASRSVLNRIRPYAADRVELPAPGRPHRLRSEWALLRTLLKARVGPWDVVYLNSQSVAPRAAVALAGPKFGRRVVYHNPDYFDPRRYPLRSRLEARLVRKADLYLNNEFHRGYVTAVTYRAACPVLTTPPNLPRAWLPAPPDVEKRAFMTNGRPDRFVLMLHGSFAEIRMCPELFRALASTGPAVSLVMTGLEHRRAEVDALLVRLGIADRVVRLPRMGFEEMLRYTVNADAGVLLYQNNDVGNFFTAPGRLTEYVASGLPVLASNHTGLENLVMRFDLGATVDSTRPDEIAAGIARLRAGVSGGRYEASRMRSVFDEHLAFDLWEPEVVRAFERLGEAGSGPTVPPFPWLPRAGGPRDATSKHET